VLLGELVEIGEQPEDLLPRAFVELGRQRDDVLRGPAFLQVRGRLHRGDQLQDLLTAQLRLVDDPPHRPVSISTLPATSP